ncbi:LOG family protein [Virgibacillus necropolis]|uniref:LOG family protein n=1 Tax=Virgibacillus necropolis TaxID=163877 RepID=UPI0029C835FC|nr:LOG family protein [Virgibacillus necropolis]
MRILTLEEFIEVFTWAQLGIHHKPCGFLILINNYDPLVSLFNHMAEQHFSYEKYHTGSCLFPPAINLIKKFYNYHHQL